MSERLTKEALVLSFPSLLQTSQTTEADGLSRSWIQLARTGTFVSSRYGEFSITKDDLRQMFENFTHVTPKAPTELPIDFDHLSMNPQKPGDGKAAGWLKDVAVRGNGDELWGLVEWTPEASQLIANKEYRFVSPSFVKDYVYKDGRNIGTTLLAAAITNHPFLEGMRAVTLAMDAAIFGDIAMRLTDEPGPNHVVGRHVSFLANEEDTPELTPEERVATYVIRGVRHGDVFVKLTTLLGQRYGWFPESALGPAPSPLRASQVLTPASQPNDTEASMSQTSLDKRAAQFSQRVTVLAKDHTMRDAFALAQAEDEAGAEAYRLAGLGADTVDPEPPALLSLSTRPGETFDQLVSRYAAERNVSLRQAIHDVGRVRPDLAAARG